jgi:hypothetical protein
MADSRSDLARAAHAHGRVGGPRAGALDVRAGAGGQRARGARVNVAVSTELTVDARIPKPVRRPSRVLLAATPVTAPIPDAC